MFQSAAGSGVQEEQLFASTSAVAPANVNNIRGRNNAARYVRTGNRFKAHPHGV